MWPMSQLPRQDPLAEDKYQSLGTERRFSREFAVGMLFLSQTTVGILGNFSLLHHYVFLHFTRGRLRSTDLILTHLTVANSLVILSKGIPQTLTAFGWKNFLNAFGCKFIFYLHRVSRGMSMSSTCLLSMFQAITINPSNSRWAELKLKAPKYIGPASTLCWVLHMLIHITAPVYVTSHWGNKTLTKKDFWYCSSVVQDITTCLLYGVLSSFPDVVCLGLMTWASGCMVIILYRHKQRVRHIHRNSISARSSPESRATQSILVLVSTFGSFYSLSSILYVCVTLFHYPTWWLVNTAALSAACFPTLSPFVLLSRDSSISRFCSVCTGKKTQCCLLVKEI